MRDDALPSSLLEPVTIPLDVQGRTVVENPVQHRSSDDMITEDLSNREKMLPSSPLPGTVRAAFTAYGSRISRPAGRAARCEE